MRVDLAIELSTVRDFRGKKLRYRAGLGNCIGEGKTQAEAKAALASAVERALTNLAAPTVLACHDGAMMTAHPFADGTWGYTFYRRIPGTRYTSGGTCLTGYGRDHALEMMRRHFYQNEIEPFVLALAALGGLS